MMLKRYFSILTGFLLFAIIGLISCSTDKISGTGTDTSTKDVYAVVNGTILDENETPVPNSIVYLVPDDYNPVKDSALDSVAIDTTDQNGNYSVCGKKPGFFNIIAISNNSNKIAIRKSCSLTEKKNYTITSDTVKNGKQVTFYTNKKIKNAGGHLFFKGTPFLADVNDSVVFKNLPQVTTSLCQTDSSISQKTVTLSDSITTNNISSLHLFSVLIIMDNPTDTSNQLFVNHFQALGATTSNTDCTNLSSFDVDTFDLILISPNADIKRTDTLFKRTSVPVIVCKHALFNLMDFTDNDSTDNFGNVDSQTTVTIVNSNHSITQGFSSGITTVFTEKQTMNFGININATVLATDNVSSSKPILFCFGKNQTMTTIAAPERRVGFFVDTNISVRYLNAAGWQIFENAVLWAIGNL